MCDAEQPTQEPADGPSRVGSGGHQGETRDVTSCLASFGSLNSDYFVSTEKKLKLKGENLPAQQSKSVQHSSKVNFHTSELLRLSTVLLLLLILLL